MPGLQRAVLLRAAAAALALGLAAGADTAVGHALARRGAERAERQAWECAEAARSGAVARAARSGTQGRPPLGGPVRPVGCGGAGR
ncbi:hypothetical protein [Kitasatospora herbaricolor]|uniref:Uncharacterized protein n=1 Tax=Kitasatospora herbaricolor TaxID=68217 RepID=A0ABZ1WF90_9ACTN|nr:hypothetical protein [Kitasatospora herbaricolor]